MTIGPENHISSLSSSPAHGSGPAQGGLGITALPNVPKDPMASAGATLSVRDSTQTPDPEEAQNQMDQLTENLSNTPAGRAMQNLSSNSKLEQAKSLLSAATPFIRQVAFLALFLTYCGSTMTFPMISVTIALVMGPSLLIVGGAATASKISEYMKEQRKEMEKNEEL